MKALEILPVPMKSSRMDNLYEKAVISLLSKMDKGRLELRLPNGSEQVFGQGNEIEARIEVHDPRLFRSLVLYGDVGFGEAYVDNYWSTPSIKSVIEWMILNISNNSFLSGSKTSQIGINLFRKANVFWHSLNKNSKENSRKNIEEHYDLGNDFYKLMLDDTLMYSSAIFSQPGESLKSAQLNKLRRLCHQLQVKPSDHVLEIGSGWGAFAFMAAEEFGAQVTTVTLSKEQFVYVSAEISKRGLEGRVTVLLKDYRDLEGKYDKIVSIEMIEAVGHEYLPTYFEKVSCLLKDDGIFSLQSILIPDTRYDEYQKGVDWIQKHIFPGGHLPSIHTIQKIVSQVSDMQVHNLYDFGLHYGRTLNYWHSAFNSRLADVKKLDFSDQFIRKWNYYLQYCEAAFNTRNVSVVQITMTRPNNTTLEEEFLNVDNSSENVA